MTAAVLPLPTIRRTFGVLRPVVRREDLTVLRGGTCGDRALHLIDLAHISTRFSRLIIASADHTFTKHQDGRRGAPPGHDNLADHRSRRPEPGARQGHGPPHAPASPRPPAEVLAARARRLPTRGPTLNPASIVPHDGTPSRMS